MLGVQKVESIIRLTFIKKITRKYRLTILSVYSLFFFYYPIMALFCVILKSSKIKKIYPNPKKLLIKSLKALKIK